MEVTKWLKPSGGVSRIGEPRLPLRVKTGSPAWASECPVLGVERKSISGGWTSVCSHKQKLAGAPELKFLHNLVINTGPIPISRSWLKVLRLGPYAHKQSVPSRGNGHRRLSVREEPWLSYA